MEQHAYRIVVGGRFGIGLRSVFADCRIDSLATGTAITRHADQAALFGLIRRVRHWSLELLEIRRLPT